jgi:hypothetical protein
MSAPSDLSYKPSTDTINPDLSKDASVESIAPSTGAESKDGVLGAPSTFPGITSDEGQSNGGREEPLTSYQ